MRLWAAEDPPGTMDIHDDRRRRYVLGPQNAQPHLRALPILDGQVFHVDRRLANLARLHLLEREPPPVGTKREQQRCPGRRCCEGVRLGF